MGRGEDSVAVGWTERAGTVRDDRGYQLQGFGWSLGIGFEELANNLHRATRYFGRAEVNGRKRNGLEFSKRRRGAADH